MSAVASGNRLATNVIEPLQSTPHDAIFSRFVPWSGPLQRGLLVDFMGFVVPRRLFCNKAYMGQGVAHALRVRQCTLSQADRHPDGVLMQTAWPVVSEEYFEYIDVLRAVDEYAQAEARRPFTFVELGAGYGHWSFTAHRALRQKAPRAPHRYLLVDVVASLRPAVERLQQLNGVAKDSLAFHVGYVSHHHQANNTQDDAAQSKYGAQMRKSYSRLWGTGETGADRMGTTTKHSLKDLLETYHMPKCIDMVDIDIQGGEFATYRGNMHGIFYGNESIQLLTHRARRVHIGMHNFGYRFGDPGFGWEQSAVDDIATRFVAFGWARVWAFPTGKRVPTPWGSVSFGDGVLSFVNPWPEAC